MSLVSAGNRFWSWFSRNDPYKLVSRAAILSVESSESNRLVCIPMPFRLMMPSARLLMLPLVDWNAWVMV